MTVCENHELPMILTVNQVAELLGICRKIAYQLVKSEGLALRCGEKRLIVPRDRFLAYLDKQNDLLNEGG